jgi:polar amino acid transport system substrate-binding protein
MRKRIALVLVALLVTGIMTGCKGEGSGDGKDKLVVGTNAEYEPFEYISDEGKTTGFDVELMEAIAKKIDVKIEWVDMPFDSLIGAMESDNVEVIAAAITASPERAKSVDFTDVYYTGSQSIIVKEGSEIDTLDELSGKKVSVLEGSVSDLMVSGELDDYGVIENAEAKRFKKSTDAVMELLNGGVDAMLTDTVIAEKFLAQNEGLVQYPIDTTVENMVFCVSKGNTELRDKLNKGLKEVKEDGTYDELFSKYFNE